MTKKQWALAGVCALTSAACLVAAAACSTEKYKFENEKFEYNTEVELTLDAGAEIDGKKNESFYGEGSVSFTETNSGVTVTTWAHIGVWGLYLYTETNDKSVYYSDEKNFYENDTVEYYIDPNPARSFAAVNSDNQVRSDMLQLRINPLGACQTWYGRKTGSYPWVRGRYNVKTAAFVNGKLNEADGANGYSAEAFIPWEAFGLEEAPEEMGVMPAFNNVSNREDTSRTWFSVKGMSHSLPTGYARVDGTGFADVGDNIQPAKALTATKDDAAYASSAELKLEEVGKDNLNPETRATIKAILGQDGAYFLAVVNDKALTSGKDNIWENDGVELVIDSLVEGGGSISRSGILRIGVDVDGGTETDVTKAGYEDYIPMRKGVIVKTSVGEYVGESTYGYRYTYVYEIMVPYASLGLAGKPASLSFAWAVKTPSEIAYLFNRTNASGVMEGDSWLWADRHYPKNPSEYYLVTENGATGGGLLPDYEFPAWADWNACAVRSEAPTRYDYRGYTAQNGLYLNMVQFVDGYRRGGDDGDWEAQTHVEMEIWNEKIGYGMGGTYFAFFLNGTYYVNNRANISEIQYKPTVTDRGADHDGYRYMISYEIYIGFNAGGGATADVQLMSYTPNESAEGYENATTITKDGTRVLYTDDCLSYTVGEDGIFRRNLPYAFPDWSAHWQKPSTSDAPARYDYRAYMAADGFYLNMKQFVNSYVAAGNGFDTQTHIELELWNDGVGWGAVTAGSSTYYAFFADGNTFENNATNRTQLQYKFTATENEAGAAYRYTLNYEVYIGFDATNRLTSAVQLYSGTPNEGSEGYGNAISVNKDGTRLVWTEDAISLTVGTEGVAKKAYLHMRDWQDCAVQSNAPTRYNYQGAVKADGVYLNVVQYADNVVSAGDGWTEQTHIEMKLYMQGLNGGKEVYLAFFQPHNANVYFNTQNEAMTTHYQYRLTDRGAESDGFRYELRYRVFLEFNTGSANTADVVFLSFAPNESGAGYENSTMEIRDNARKGMRDNCASYTVGAEGITKRNAYAYSFPAWYEWGAEGTVQSKATSRYNYRGYSKADGFYLNMVQYVDNVALSGDNWANTHVEFQHWNNSAYNGMFVALFLDGTAYLSDGNAYGNYQYRYTITDRGTDYNGFRYEISYELFIGYNNADKNVSFLFLMSMTPNESEEGYENSEAIFWDNQRHEWGDYAQGSNKSYIFAEAGVTGRIE